MATMRPIKVMVLGNLAALDLDDGTTLTIPKNFGLIRDPMGSIGDKCDLYVSAYKKSRNPIGTIPKGMVKDVDDYFGESTPRTRVTVEIPKGPWQRLGVVRTIHYVRYNDDNDRDGPFYHHFDGSEGPWSYTFSDRDPTVVLYESICARAFKLELPDGCLLSGRGLIWP